MSLSARTRAGADGRERAHRLALGIDRLAPALGVLAPVGNWVPMQRVEGKLPGVTVVPDNQDSWWGAPFGE
jgi:hypothetical protein